jgi:hypothetical protein
MLMIFHGAWGIVMLCFLNVQPLVSLMSQGHDAIQYAVRQTAWYLLGWQALCASCTVKADKLFCQGARP